MKTILLCGTFDGLHYGHLSLFKQAKRIAGRVVVIVARDKTAEHVKGRKPVHSEKQRLEMLRHIDLLSQVRLGDHQDVYQGLKEIKPDFIGLGYDQKVFVRDLPKKIKELGMNTKIVRLKPFRPKRFKSSQLLCRQDRSL